MFKRKLATHAVAAGHEHKAQHKHVGWLKPKPTSRWPVEPGSSRYCVPAQ